MILSTRKCGCPYESELPAAPPPNTNLYYQNDCSSSEESESECDCCLPPCSDHSETEEESEGSEGPCVCPEEGSGESVTPNQKVIVSEIASKGMPYKEIEAEFNNNRVIVRLQKEKPPPEYDPPCDCIENPAGGSSSQFNNELALQPRNSIVFQKSEGCRTINVYPHPDPKADIPSRYDDRSEGRKDAKNKKIMPLPTVNPEENPNIFVLKIKRKCKGKDIRQNLDLEFKSPRPWQKRDYFL